MKLNEYIDHTLLKPESQKAAVQKVIDEAVENHFASVMVNPYWIPFVKEQVKGTDVKAACVIGFPLGASTKKTKVFEAQDAVENGADELDMVINIGALKDHDDAYVIDEIRALKEVAGERVLKVIIETCLLTDEEKVRACKDAVAAGADFVKTSTGFSAGGATIEDVKLMKETVAGSPVKVKASGGIRTKEVFAQMIEAGAERIGTSSGVALIK